MLARNPTSSLGSHSSSAATKFSKLCRQIWIGPEGVGRCRQVSAPGQGRKAREPASRRAAGGARRRRRGEYRGGFRPDKDDWILALAVGDPNLIVTIIDGDPSVLDRLRRGVEEKPDRIV